MGFHEEELQLADPTSTQLERLEHSQNRSPYELEQELYSHLTHPLEIQVVSLSLTDPELQLAHHVEDHEL